MQEVLNVVNGQLQDPNNYLTNNLVSRQNSALPHEVWRQIDKTALDVFSASLVAAQDLVNAGLTLNINNVGVMASGYEKINDFEDAIVSMDPAVRGDKQKLTYEMETFPIPFHQQQFELGTRQLAASRSNGYEGLDVTQARTANRKVAEQIEKMIFSGVPQIGTAGASSEIYGYTTHPNRITMTPTGTNWATAAGRDIIGDVLNMENQLIQINRRGPFFLYVAKNIWNVLQNDYKAESDKTFLNRILDIDSISAVKMGYYLPDNNAVLVQMDLDTVDLAIAQDLVNLQNIQTDMDCYPFVSRACMALRIKSDANNTTGIVHLAPN